MTTTATACPADDLLVAMVERSLAPEQFAALESHIDSCEQCRRTLAAAVHDTALAVGTPETGASAVGTPPLALRATVADGDGDAAADALAKLVDVSINERYVIEAVLGRGGMGTVYLARDLSLDREVALKLHRAGSGSERLHREAMAMAKLAHPNVVTVFEVATVDDRLYVAMEYVRGETLRGWRGAHPRGWREIIAMLLETGNGLAAAHSAGLIHRDFKPENVLVGDDGRPRVGDFGLARVGAAPSGERPLASTPLDSRMTATGMLLGTPAYMAPEQLAGDIVDTRCDQFAFCVVAWELLYGRRPYTGATIAALEDAIHRGERYLPAKSDVPPRVRAVLERGLSVRPDERYADMPALLAALRAAARPRTRRWLALGLAASLVAVAASAGGVAFARDRKQAATCDAAEGAMYAAFDPASRLAGRASFIATGAPDANAAFTRTEKVLARYSTALARQARRVCDGIAEPRAVTYARQQCLADRRRTLGHFVSQLGTSDRIMVGRAVNIAWGLFEADPCDDPQTLLAVARTSATTLPEVAEKLHELEVAKDLGHSDSGIPLGESIVEDARKRGDKNAELKGLLGLANLYADVENVEHTIKSLEQAIALAETMGRDLDAAMAYTALANHHGVVTNDYVAAHRAIGLARAKLARLNSENPGLRGELLMNEAQIFADENRLGEAERAMTDAARTIESAYGPEHPKLGAAYGTLSQILRYQNKNDAALAAAERALTVLSASYGARHPYVAGAEMTLGQILTDFGRHAEARDRYTRADAVFTAVYGNNHPYRAAIAANIGDVHLRDKNFAAAEASFRNALSVVERTKGAVHTDACAARGDIARAIAMSGRPAEALEEQLHVVHDCYEKLGADGEPRLIGGLLDLAHYQLDTTAPLAAVASAERALGILAKRPADANPAEVAEAKFLLARALWDAHPTERATHARARKLAEEARGAPLNEDLSTALDAWLAAHR